MLWGAISFHRRSELNGLREIWQDTDMRFWDLLWFHSLTPTKTLHYSSWTTSGVTQHVSWRDIWMNNVLGYCHGRHSPQVFAHGRHSPQVFAQSNICGMRLIVALNVVILKTLTSWNFYVRSGRRSLYMKSRTFLSPCTDAAIMSLTQTKGTKWTLEMK